MTKQMPVIVIDPFAAMEGDFDRFVREEVHNGDYRDIYRLLTPEGGRQVDMFQPIYPFGSGSTDCIYVDEEALFHPISAVFMLDGWPEPFLIGCGVVVGTDNQGGTISPTITVEEVRKKVSAGMMIG